MLVSLDANLKVVADNTARLALYPSPTGNERVFNLTSGNLERYSASLGAWVVDVVTPATPELYGAQGDGTTDDSAALLSAIATGKNVSLSFGKTYLVSKPLVLSANQSLFGNGATIKRANQVTTTTTGTLTSGVTNSITVAAGTGANFRVGQVIDGINGAN